MIAIVVGKGYVVVVGERKCYCSWSRGCCCVSVVEEKTRKVLCGGIFFLMHMMREGCRRENTKCMARGEIFFSIYTHYYT